MAYAAYAHIPMIHFLNSIVVETDALRIFTPDLIQSIQHPDVNEQSEHVTFQRQCPR